MVLVVTSVAGCGRSGFQQRRGGGVTGTSGATGVSSQSGAIPVDTSANDAGGTGGVLPDGGPSATVDTSASPVPPDKCEPIGQLPAGSVPVCTYTGGKPGWVSGCSMFPVRLFMDAGSYYFVTTESPGIIQCPRDKPEAAIQLSTGTYTGVAQESLSVEVLAGGLVHFRCRTDEPNGPGFSHDILCSYTGIQIIPIDKGHFRICLEFPGTESTPGAAGYFGWLPYDEIRSPPECNDTGVSPQIDYTSISGYPGVTSSLGSQPVTCAISNGSKTLSFKDLLGQPVTIVLGGVYGVINVRWQRSGGP